MDNKVFVYLIASQTDDFVGFEYLNNKIFIIYPFSLALFPGEACHVLDFQKDKEKIKLLSIFIRSFGLANDIDKINNQSPVDSKLSCLDYPFEAYQYMIDDYRRYGRYIEFESKFSLNGNGNIDWKRTFKGQPMYVNGEPHYLNLITKQKVLTSNIICDIYNYCVYESVFKFGSWFYGMNCNSIPTKVKWLKPSLKKQYIKLLNDKINDTFNDDVVKRLQNMLLILKGVKENDGIQKIGLKNYHSVFEKLIKWGLNNVGDLRIFNPRAMWNSIEAEDKLYPLRLDALRICNNVAYVIDAKFYQTSKPETSDIQKQITYGENLYNKRDYFVNFGYQYERSKIYNIFISPCSVDKMSNNVLVDSNYIATGNWRTNSFSYEKVFLFYINFKALLELWNSNSCLPLINSFESICSMF